MVKYYRNHHVSATDWETQAELTLILDKLVGDNFPTLTDDD